MTPPEAWAMRDWNIVVCVYQEGFRRVLHALRDFGTAERSPYYNVLVMLAEDPLGPRSARKTDRGKPGALRFNIASCAGDAQLRLRDGR